MGIAEDIADKLAADVIAHLERTGDEDAVTLISKTLGDSSQTLQEAFITSVRVQRAAIRAQKILAERVETMAATAAAPAPDRAALPPSPAPEPAEAEIEVPASEPEPEPPAPVTPRRHSAPPTESASRAVQRARRLLEEREAARLDAAREAELKGAARRGQRAVPQVRDDS